MNKYVYIFIMDNTRGRLINWEEELVKFKNLRRATVFIDYLIGAFLPKLHESVNKHKKN